MTTRFTIAALASAGLCLATVAHSQTKEAVILYNSVPVEVDLTRDGEIQRFKKERPDYLRGYVVDTKADLSRPIADMSSVEIKTEQGQEIEASDLYISFTPNDPGDMDAQSLDVLNSIVGNLRSDASKMVTLTASEMGDPSIQSQRLASCKRYVTTQGIANDRVITTLSKKVTDPDRITLKYQ